jgi:hypothetical protein
MAETGRTRDSIAKYRTDQRQKELEAGLRARSGKSQRQKARYKNIQIQKKPGKGKVKDRKVPRKKAPEREKIL